jgi:hypothetical protein
MKRYALYDELGPPALKDMESRGAGCDEGISGECRSGRLGSAGQAFQRGSGSALTGVIVVVQTFMPGCKNSLSFSRSSVSTTM